MVYFCFKLVFSLRIMFLPSFECSSQISQLIWSSAFIARYDRSQNTRIIESIDSLLVCKIELGEFDKTKYV